MLKVAQQLLTEPRAPRVARFHGRYFVSLYNEARPHNVLGYLPPATFAAERWWRGAAVIGHSAPRPVAPSAEAVIPMKPLTF
jgi:hypothetical protein